MNAKKCAAFLLAALMIITVFTACKQNENSTQTEAQENQESSSIKESSEAQVTPEPQTEPEPQVEPEPQPEPEPEKVNDPEPEPETPTEPEHESEPEPEPVAASTTAEKIVELAEKLIGTEYESGGQGPDTFDNSGFVYYVCKENGVKIPRRTSEIASAGEEVDRDSLLPGDIVVFSNDIGGSAGFVGIYVGDDQFIACNNAKTPTKQQNMAVKYWEDRFLSGRRVA